MFRFGALQQTKRTCIQLLESKVSGRTFATSKTKLNNHSVFDDSDGFDWNFHFLDLKDLKGIMSGSPKGGKKSKQPQFVCTSGF